MDDDWTHRLELRVPSDKIFFHYRIIYNPSVDDASLATIKRQPDHVEMVMKLHLGVPQDPRKIPNNFKKFQKEKSGILIKEHQDVREAEQKKFQKRLDYQEDFFLPVKVQNFVHKVYTLN